MNNKAACMVFERAQRFLASLKDKVLRETGRFPKGKLPCDEWSGQLTTS